MSFDKTEESVQRAFAKFMKGFSETNPDMKMHEGIRGYAIQQWTEKAAEQIAGEEGLDDDDKERVRKYLLKILSSGGLFSN